MELVALRALREKSPSGVKGSRCSKLVHGVAFLCGIITPSLAAQGEQRRFFYFNIERDNSKSFVEKAQVVVVRRHRRWSCWWFRGRRVTGWR